MTGNPQKGRPGKNSPAVFAFYSPRPPLRSFTKESAQRKTPVRALTRSQGFSRFFGASSVASALGIRLDATPCGRPHPTMPFSAFGLKQDISTLLGIGHFYFALTLRHVGLFMGGGFWYTSAKFDPGPRRVV